MSSSASPAARQILARSGGATIGYQSVQDTDYTALPTDRQIGFVGTLTAQRTVYFPDVDTFPPGEVFFVSDETGMASATLSIAFAPGPGTGDQIGDGSPIGITSPYQGLGFRRGAVNLWIRAR